MVGLKFRAFQYPDGYGSGAVAVTVPAAFELTYTNVGDPTEKPKTTMPASGIGATQGAPGGHSPPQRNCSVAIGEWPAGRTAMAPAMAAAQVNAGGG